MPLSALLNSAFCSLFSWDLNLFDFYLLRGVCIRHLVFCSHYFSQLYQEVGNNFILMNEDVHHDVVGNVALPRLHNPKGVQLCTWGSARRNSHMTSKITYTLVALVVLSGSKHRGMRSFVQLCFSGMTLYWHSTAVGLQPSDPSCTLTWGYGLLVLPVCNIGRISVEMVTGLLLDVHNYFPVIPAMCMCYGQSACTIIYS